MIATSTEAGTFLDEKLRRELFGSSRSRPAEQRTALLREEPGERREKGLLADTTRASLEAWEQTRPAGWRIMVLTTSGEGKCL